MTFGDSGIALVDSRGVILRLDATEDGTALLNHSDGTVWVIPEALRSELVRYGVALPH